MGARREVVSAVMERYRSAERAEKGRILDALCATTGWHRKHAVRTLRQRETVGSGEVEAPRERKRRYGATIKDAMTALWEASDRVYGKRLKVMIPILLPALEQHGRFQLGQADRDRVLAISAATIDRLLVDVKIAASGGRRRRAGFYSAIRREVPIRTFNDWNSPPPGFCEVDMVAHGGTSVAGSFIQTLTMVDVATGWAECLPLVTREGTESVPLALARRGLRQRHLLHERCRRAMMSRTEARSHTLARLEEERSGVSRADEWCPPR